jgi:predicted AAA+ superfamily ATPase
MITRDLLEKNIHTALKRSRVVALIGPRQSGKTTLARQFVSPGSSNYFDLEDPSSLSRLEQPMLALEGLKGTVIIDEIQRRPELFPVLRVLSDRQTSASRFLILGSASPELLRQSSETLAGRLETIIISGFSLEEVGWAKLPVRWLRGGFPLSFLAGNEVDSLAWRRNFVQTFLERDVPQLGFRMPAAALQRFWTMLAHYHGQIWNAAEPARSLGISESSVRRYLDLLTAVFMVRQLQPWHVSLKKRQVKAPKIYFRDTGLLHQMLGIRTEKELLENPKCGASWEGFAIEEIIRSTEPDEVYFWATHSGAEIDLVLMKNGRMFGVECKRADAPGLTPSMKIALEDLKLREIAVVYPGARRYPLAPKINAVPFKSVLDGMKGIFTSV